jgi:hypothetical protein
VHGDVSPDNVLFDADGAPMLVDPGLARALGETRPRGGTDGFRAPEVEHGAPADVYGWGALAWFVLTGETAGEERVRVPLPVLRSEVGAEAGELIEDCLATDEALRPTAVDLGAALQAAHAAQPLDATAAAGADGVAFLRTRAAPVGRVARLRQRLCAWLGVGRGARRPHGGSLARGRTGTRAGTGTGSGARLWRRLRLGLLLGVVIAAAVLWGRELVEGAGVKEPRESAPVAQARAASPSTGATSGRAETVKSAVKALPALDRQRTKALAHRDVEILDTVYVDGPALKADTATIRELHKNGTRFVALTSKLEKLETLDEGSGRATNAGGDVLVRAKATTTGKQAKLSDAVDPNASAKQHTGYLVFTMTSTEAGWRIRSVREAG